MGDSQAEVGTSSDSVPDTDLEDHENSDLVDAVDSINDSIIADDEDDTLGGDISSVDGVTIGDQATLQSLLAGTGLSATGAAGLQLAGTANGETIQIIAVPSTSDLFSAAGKVWHVLPNVNSSEIATIIVNQNECNSAGEDLSQSGGESEETANNGGMQVVDMVPVSGLPGVGIILPDMPMPSKPLPPGAPAWATRLQDCEVIGDSYRGWVETEVELDLLLTYHKQQTQSFWGTRQSPSPAKLSTRLMWKSQYVPFDGIPFINSGSRAIVMECQYGPRRKGAQIKRQGDHVIRSEFRQTCPARIYIKKVRKFPDYRVDISQDKKLLKATMEKAFHLLKERGVEGHGQERFYVQLPTEKGHEYHGDPTTVKAEYTSPAEIESDFPHRLHPKVGQKIRDLVSAGETKLYVIRKILRRFVERELFDNAEEIPEKHDLTYYPTVNDLQNHIHQALKDVQAGLLPLTAPTLNVEFIANRHIPGNERVIWPAGATGQPHAETVTVTLTQQPGEDGHHVISKVETHLSDGSTQISDNLTPETAQLLAKLHPNMFTAVDGISEIESSHSTRVTDSLLSEGADTEADNVKDIKVDEDVDDLNSHILDNKGDPMEDIELQLEEDGATSDGLDDLSIHVIGEAHSASPPQTDDEDSQPSDDGVQIVTAASLGNLEDGGQFIQHPDGSLQLIPASAFDGHQLHIDDESLKSLELAGKLPHGLVALVTEDGQMVLQYNKSDDESATNDLSILKEEDMDSSPY